MKSEKGKMLAGELYFASAPELRSEFFRPKKLTRDFNAPTEEQIRERSSGPEAS